MHLDPEFLLRLLISAPPLLLALSLHELAHGYVALQLGDPTAKQAGRLTMNPLKHLDILGVLAFIFFNVGWAKPVPVDPRYFRNPQKDMLAVALAGPAANVALAIASAILLRLLTALDPGQPGYALTLLLLLLKSSVWINVMLAIFNLLPIPPLDGSRILMGVLPTSAAYRFAGLEPYGIILVLVLFYLGIIGKIIMPIIQTLAKFLQG